MALRRLILVLVVLGVGWLFWKFGSTPTAPPSTGESMRILSLSPNITEILFRLGLGEDVVGVTDFCRYPVEAAEKSKVGGLLNPNLEKMFALEPSVVFFLPANADLGRKLDRRGVRSFLVRNDTVEDVLGSIRLIGRVAGCADRSTALIDSLRSIISDVKSRRSSSGRPTMIVVSRADGAVRDIIAAGPGTFLTELLSLAGGENVFGESAARYPEVSVESVLYKNPEVIIELREGGIDQAAEERVAREAWSRLPGLAAAERGNIFVLVGDHLLVPGPRLGMALQEISAALREAD